MQAKTAASFKMAGQIAERWVHFSSRLNMSPRRCGLSSIKVRAHRTGVRAEWKPSSDALHDDKLARRADACARTQRAAAEATGTDPPRGPLLGNEQLCGKSWGGRQEEFEARARF